MLILDVYKVRFLVHVILLVLDRRVLVLILIIGHQVLHSGPCPLLKKSMFFFTGIILMEYTEAWSPYRAY